MCRLYRVGEKGAEIPVIELTDGKTLDLSSSIEDLDTAFYGDFDEKRLSTLVRESHFPEISLEGKRLGPPISRPGKIVCIGLNYAEHAKETGGKAPEEPVVFLKASSALSGPNDPITLPPGSKHCDWEVELAVVIGKEAQCIDESEAMQHVFGYTIMNDVSEREYQKRRGGQWTKGKSFSSFAPLGPCITLASLVADPQKLRLSTKVNDITRQNSSTEDMIFPISFLVAYLSQFMTLEPGDIISTGTPSGVAMGMEKPTYLRPGDLVQMEIQELGTMSQKVS